MIPHYYKMLSKRVKLGIANIPLTCLYHSRVHIWRSDSGYLLILWSPANLVTSLNSVSLSVRLKYLDFVISKSLNTPEILRLSKILLQLVFSIRVQTFAYFVVLTVFIHQFLKIILATPMAKGSNPCHRSGPNHSSHNARSLTHWGTRELLYINF